MLIEHIVQTLAYIKGNHVYFMEKIMNTHFRTENQRTWAVYLVIALVLSLLFTDQTRAQLSDIYPQTEASEYGFIAGMDLNLGTPLSGFANTMDRVGFGFTIHGAYQIKNRPLNIGLDFGFLNFGRDRRDEPISSTIPDLTVLVENTYNLMHSSVLLRLIQPSGKIRPYLETAVGFNYLYTETLIENTGIYYEEPVFRSTNFDDFTFSYGMGAGLMIELGTYTILDVLKEEVRIERILLNLMGRYKAGGSADYLKKGSITVQNGQAFYDVSRSETDVFYYTAGIVFTF